MALAGTWTSATQIPRPLAPSPANDNTSYVMQPSSDTRHCWWDSSHLAARPRSPTKLNDDPIPNPPTLGLSSTCSLCRTAPRPTILETNCNRNLSETSKSKSSCSAPSSYNHEQSVRGDVCQDNVYYIDSWSAACLEPDLKPHRADWTDNAKDVGLKTLKYMRANGSISKKAVPVDRCPAAYPGTRHLLRKSPSATRESSKSNVVFVPGGDLSEKWHFSQECRISHRYKPCPHMPTRYLTPSAPKWCGWRAP
jgi:hypothetical protein